MSDVLRFQMDETVLITGLSTIQTTHTAEISIITCVIIAISKRAAAIYTEDERKSIRKSHENPSIIQLYEEYLGEPGSEKAHSLLHTEYFPKSNEMTIHLNGSN